MTHRYFPESDWSIWIDNKSRLLVDPLAVLDRLRGQSDAAFFAFAHFARDCVYDEALAVLENGLEAAQVVRERVARYRAEGMPAHAGLIEGHFILRRHHDPAVAHFGERWFEHVLRYSRRDQLSFPYLAWRLGLRWAPITAIDRRETVEFSVHDRAGRTPPFPRQRVVRQWLRARLRGARGG
jgi:hypothetical protein